MALKQTPLNEDHRAMGANMVDFGGWDMPVNYGSQIAEHHQVRHDCGIFDVSHMRVVDIKGKGARDFLRYLLANNVDKLTQPGKALYSCMLQESGGVVDDLIVYFLEESWFRLVVNSGTADKDIVWMKQKVVEHATAHPECYAESGSQSETCAEGSAKPGDLPILAGPPGEAAILPLSIADLPDMAIIAVQGPKAREKLWAAMPGTQRLTENLAPFNGVLVGSMFIARTGYTGEDGFEVMIPAQAAPYFWNSLVAKGVKPCGLGARDTLRLEAGMNLYGHDMDETTSPLEAGLGWTVDLKSERNFIGKAALLANPPARKLVGLVLLDRGVLREHQKVLTKTGAGEVTSGTFSPTLERSIAFARVPDDVRIDDVVQVEVRDKILDAKVVRYPFARNGKAVVSYQPLTVS